MSGLKRLRETEEMENVKTDDLSKSVYENASGMPLLNKKTIHMELGVGDLARRIITIGSESRLKKLALYLDKSNPPKYFTSHRGFLTATGTYNGVELSLVAIGMGLPMMDFFVRESCAVLTKSAVIARFGTCGGISEVSRPGTIAVASKGSGLVTRNYDAFTKSNSNNGSHTDTVSPTRNNDSKYRTHTIAPSNPILSQLVISELKIALGEQDKPAVVIEGCNVTADTFYASQGRTDPNFDDENHDLITQIKLAYPDAKSMEMETFQLFHLASCSKLPLYVTSAAIILANRLSQDTVTIETLGHLEVQGGLAIIKAICKFDLLE